jgi:hypothetical protein
MQLINTRNAGNRLLLSRCVRQRREDLGLTITRASELAGMAFSEWCALESGWTPCDRAILHSIRATLMTGFNDFYSIVQMSLQEVQ